MKRVSEAELERIRESIKDETTDPIVAQQWIQRAKADLASLVEDLTDRYEESGGELASTIRDLLRPRIEKELNKRVTLTTEASEHSLIVSILPDQVVVDVRLRLGSAR